MEKERIIDILEKESEFEKVSATYLFYGDKRVDLIYYAKEFCKLILLKNKQSTGRLKDLADADILSRR